MVMLWIIVKPNATLIARKIIKLKWRIYRRPYVFITNSVISSTWTSLTAWNNFFTSITHLWISHDILITDTALSIYWQLPISFSIAFAFTILKSCHLWLAFCTNISTFTLLTIIHILITWNALRTWSI